GRIWSLGGRFAYEDQGQTPNTQMAVLEYGDVLLVFEVRGLVTKDKGFRVGNEYYTDEGMIKDGKFYPKNGGDAGKRAESDVKVTPGGSWGSFLHAVRSRKVEECNADVEVAHLSCVAMHAANVSYRLGEKVPFSAATQKLGDNHEVVETFNNLQENLKGNGVRLEETSYQLGRTLMLDAKTERFVGDGAEQANALLTRAYRAPFVVPEKI